MTFAPKSLAAATAAALAVAFGVAGCGGSTTTTVTQADTSPTSSTQPTTPTTPDTTPTIPTTTSPTSPSETSAGSESQAEAKVNDLGYNVDDPGDYDSSSTLRVLIGTKKGSGDGYNKLAFFFVGARYIGTDTQDPSAGVKVVRQSDDTVTLGYAIYGSGDALCCPSGERDVRYRWTGSRLDPLDPIPSADARG